ncbi:MarR family winged helix-turn-helix transcriptional regulator [Amnibacterium kyonggiense]|uniref:DNA-binding MarR family transcriptional regulator n=1 Tax=Amnibacterium kyonggiense TaxID=595671 RepID=A0A4R7FS33_9MICO|nr:MarR family transcriptional regulator [Amnibacterium kyonggiense]TDS80479.1 DNA-binding MarR family transcriptional regulator [Amnibacterium kyonggiense]
MSIDPEDLALRDALVRSSFEVMGRLSRLAAEEGMSLTQLRVLGVLRDRRPRMAELAQGLGLDRSSVTGLIDRAQAKGLVERVAEEGDGRGVRVVLTAEGQRVAALLADRVSELLADAVAPLSPAMKRSLREGLEATFVSGF